MRTVYFSVNKYLLMYNFTQFPQNVMFIYCFMHLFSFLPELDKTTTPSLSIRSLTPLKR